ncbi:MAG: efflux RND transporter periplasmic adaptor subunit, partial [Acidobacteria bacterium]|nr:efflux RND transporter periplasmic adaptor subunit [Acidobacteriota bacterium]
LQEARAYQEHQLEATRTEKVFHEQETKLELLSKKARDEAKIAQTKLQGKKEDYALLEKRIGQLELKASQAGLVVHANHLWEGRKLRANDTIQAGWAVVEIPQMDTLFVKAWVTEFEREKVQAGQAVQVVLDAYKDKIFAGKVQSIEPTAQKRRNWGETPLFAVHIALEKVDASLMRPGMSARAEITTQHLDDAWKVPLQAIVFDRGTFWVKAEGREPRQVEPLGRNGFYLAIQPVADWKPDQRFEPAPFALKGGEP